MNSNQTDSGPTVSSKQKLSMLHDVESLDDRFTTALSSPELPDIEPSVITTDCLEILVDFGQIDMDHTSSSAAADTSFVLGGDAGVVTCVRDISSGDPYVDISEDTVLIPEEHAQKVLDIDDPFTCLIPKYSSTDSETGIEPGLCTHLLETDRQVPSYNIRQPHRMHGTLPSYSPRIGQLTVAKCPSIFYLHWNWAAIRLGCFVMLVFTMVSMFCVVIRLVASNEAGSDLRRGWWQGTVSYEIFPASFQDSDSDGFGDLRGLIQRLDYIQSLNVASVRLNSIFSALDYPLEYTHIIDFLRVDPHLGRMSDFDLLVKDLHARNLRLILDINPSLTSDQHTWAAHWLQNSSGQYRYYYVGNETLENVSDFEDDEKENPSRPFGSKLFLNWSHSAVHKEMENVLEFWLQKGVDGFYMKGLEQLRQDNHTGLYVVMKRWRHLLDIYSKDANKKIMVVSDIFLNKLKNERSPNLGLILDLCDLIDVQLHISLNQISSIKTQILQAADWNSISIKPWTHWHLGSAETSRLATRIDSSYTLGAMIFLLMLPGSISLFYGDEINLQNSIDVTTGKTYNEGQLCPMQWEPTFEANFTGNGSLSWLPVRPDFLINNVAQRNVNVSLISQVISIKQNSSSLGMKAEFKDESVTRGKEFSTFLFHHIDNNLVVLERHFPGNKKYVVFAEFGETRRTLDFSRYFSSVKILFSTKEVSETPNVGQLSLSPGAVLIGEVGR
ncbi:neutral and basic amino acid transport protein rBAT-like isoform X2 [Limulus polyphemus]|nr:neutral and basic amino acid transport protein rBAT-like isoform X2 [Limulus polyphemus]